MSRENIISKIFQKLFDKFCKLEDSTIFPDVSGYNGFTDRRDSVMPDKQKQKQRIFSNDRKRNTARAAFHFAMAALLSTATVLSNCSPFGIAYAAACCSFGNGFSAVLGTFCGYLLAHPGAEGVKYAGAALIVMTAATVFSGTGMVESKWFLPLSASLATCMTGFLFVTGANFTVDAVLYFSAELVLAFAMTYFYMAAYSKRIYAQTLRFGGVMTLAASGLIALYPLLLWDMFSPSRIAAAFLVMGVAYLGGFAYGAAQGAGMGVAMDAAGAEGWLYAGIFAFAGMISGFFTRGGRVVFAAVFLLGTGAAGLLGDSFRPYSFCEACIAAAIFLVVPDRIWRRVREVMLPTDPEPTDYAARVCRVANRYATAASEAFSEMYEALTRGVLRRKEDNDLGAVFDRTADRVCRRCSSRELCWERDKLATIRTLDAVSGQLLRTGHVSVSDFPGHFAAQCLRFSDFILAINEGMDALYQRRQNARRSEQGRKLIAQQYAGVTGVLKQIGEYMSTGPEAMPNREQELRQYAEAFGGVRTAAAWRDYNGRMHLELSGECMPRIIQNRDGFLSGLSALMGKKLTGPESVSGPGGTSLLFREQEPYRITIGIGAKTREGETVSGDTTSWFTTEEGVACVILSDGMGTGKKAAEESGTIVRMAERFLKAGIDAADVVRTIGPALKLRTQGNSFATLDVGTIDLFTGTAQSIKCGAAPSFIRAVDGDGSIRIRKILSSTLPAGLEESGEMDVTRFRMGSGDAMVLLSDGVMDSGGSSSVWIEDMLMQSMHLSARELAARIVLEASARGAPDDMTAAVVYLDKRTA